MRIDPIVLAGLLLYLLGSYFHFRVWSSGQDRLCPICDQYQAHIERCPNE